MADREQRTWTPYRLAVCSAPDGPHEHVELKPGEEPGPCPSCGGFCEPMVFAPVSSGPPVGEEALAKWLLRVVGSASSVRHAKRVVEKLIADDVGEPSELREASCFSFFFPLGATSRFDEIKVERTYWPHMDAGPFTPPHPWAIRRGSECLNRDGEWEREPLPSSREQDFLARCRFELDEALGRARSLALPEGERTR